MPRIASWLLALGLLLWLPATLRAQTSTAAGAQHPFAPDAPPVLAEGERARLDAGDVIVRSLEPTDGKGVAALAMGLVEAPLRRVWPVIADCDEQDEYLPRIAHAEVRDRDGDSHTCELVIDLPFPLEDARAASRNHVRRLPDGGYQRRWELLPGDWSYHRSQGSWSVHPFGDGVSLLVNRMDAHPKTALPVWFLRMAQTRQAPATFDAIRQRVREEATQPRTE